MAPAPKLVIFDCDGVLVDSETISNRVLARMLTAEGLTTTLEQSRRKHQGLLLSDIRARAERELKRSLPEDWIAGYESERDAAFRAELQPVPGAAEAVTRISGAGIGVCVASQSKSAKIDLALELTGLERLFPTVVRFSSYSVANGKPAPDVFLHAAASMGVKPRDCLVVEDSASGVSAGVSAGMQVVGYAADSDERTIRAAGATAIVYSHKQLIELLGLC